MNENEFKKLASNSRDWLIYNMLSEKSKESWSTQEHMIEDLKNAERILIQPMEYGDKPRIIKAVVPANPKGETTVQEIVTGIVKIVTEKAVLIGVGNRVAWFPKATILNLDKIVLEKDTTVELKIVEWFKYKIEWKVNEQ